MKRLTPVDLIPGVSTVVHIFQTKPYDLTFPRSDAGKQISGSSPRSVGPWRMSQINGEHTSRLCRVSHHSVWLLWGLIHLEAGGDGKVKGSRVEQAGRGWDRTRDLLGVRKHRRGSAGEGDPKRGRKCRAVEPSGGESVSGLRHKP